MKKLLVVAAVALASSVVSVSAENGVSGIQFAAAIAPSRQMLSVSERSAEYRRIAASINRLQGVRAQTIGLRTLILVSPQAATNPAIKADLRGIVLQFQRINPDIRHIILADASGMTGGFDLGSNDALGNLFNELDAEDDDGSANVGGFFGGSGDDDKRDGGVDPEQRPFVPNASGDTGHGGGRDGVYWGTYNTDNF